MPVKNGQPTEADFGETWRMVLKVVMLDNVSRPVIYPASREGIWTIDENNTFSKFGGIFPANIIDDVFIGNPATGQTVGIGSEGLFLYRPGETAFTQISKADGSPLTVPAAGIYASRLEGFVVSDNAGLYLLDKQLRLKRLPVNLDVGSQASPFDLPELHALLLNPDGRVYLREDDGNTVLLASLEDGDFVTSTSVTLDLQIHIKTYRNEFTVAMPKKDSRGRFIEAANARDVRERPPAALIMGTSIVTSWGGSFVWNAAGLWHRHDGAQTRIELPFDAEKFSINSAQDFPHEQKLVVVSKRGLFTFDKHGHWTEIPLGQAIVADLTKSEGVIPHRRSMVISASDGLYLLVSQSDPAAIDCMK